MIDGNFSFIETVFPNFKPSQLNALAPIKSLAPNKVAVPSPPNVDEIYNKFVKEKTSNSYFYNPPLFDKINSPLTGKPISQLNGGVVLEKMTNQMDEKKMSNEDYVEYVLNNDECRKMIMKSLSLESSKRQNNTTIEFIAFVLIGIFLIYLISK